MLRMWVVAEQDGRLLGVYTSQEKAKAAINSVHERNFDNFVGAEDFVVDAPLALGRDIKPPFTEIEMQEALADLRLFEARMKAEREGGEDV